MSSLELHDVSKYFGRVKALQHVSLHVDDGEFLILLGPTGAGKTTTLRCVAGLEKLNTGAIHMDGESIDHLSPAERDVAMVFQSYALYPRKTVAQNIAFPLEARSIPTNAIQERTLDIARKLDIDTLLERYPAALSGGQQQRVALGRAMVREPRVFLMDEPLTNLDFKLRVEMRGELKRLQKELGATFFYVTNDQVEAMSMADRIAVLNEGVLQQIDTPETIYAEPANMFVAQFVGSPRINFLDCVLDSANRKLVAVDDVWCVTLSEAQQSTIEAQSEAGTMVFGIRAEDIDLVRAEDEAAIAGTVYVIEPLGDRTIVDVRLENGDMVKIKVHPSFSVMTGEAVWLRFDSEHFHIFDKETGAVIL